MGAPEKKSEGSGENVEEGGEGEGVVEEDVVATSEKRSRNRIEPDTEKREDIEKNDPHNCVNNICEKWDFFN